MRFNVNRVGEGRILTEMTNGRINAEKQRNWA